uniref:Uncharacterized protein n=1 Tax=Anopheles coluzzii TaxID=1518534 RepID=A0A8W7PFN3_ANOCL
MTAICASVVLWMGDPKKQIHERRSMAASSPRMRSRSISIVTSSTTPFSLSPSRCGICQPFTCIEALATLSSIASIWSSSATSTRRAMDGFQAFHASGSMYPFGGGAARGCDTWCGVRNSRGTTCGSVFCGAPCCFTSSSCFSSSGVIWSGWNWSHCTYAVRFDRFMLSVSVVDPLLSCSVLTPSHGAVGIRSPLSVSSSGMVIVGVSSCTIVTSSSSSGVAANAPDPAFLLRALCVSDNFRLNRINFTFLFLALCCNILRWILLHCALGLDGWRILRHVVGPALHFFERILIPIHLRLGGFHRFDVDATTLAQIPVPTPVPILSEAFHPQLVQCVLQLLLVLEGCFQNLVILPLRLFRCQMGVLVLFQLSAFALQIAVVFVRPITACGVIVDHGL